MSNEKRLLTQYLKSKGKIVRLPENPPAKSDLPPNEEKDKTEPRVERNRHSPREHRSERGGQERYERPANSSRRRSWSPPTNKFRKLDPRKDLETGGYKVQEAQHRLINYSVDELKLRQDKLGSELTLLDRRKFLKDFNPASLRLPPEQRQIYEQNPHMRQVFANQYPFRRISEPFSIAHRRATPSTPRKPYQRRLGHAKTVEHWGQRKLLFSEIEFLTLYGDPSCLVIYAGAAPGNHIPFLSELFPDYHFVLVDPAPFNIESTDNIKVVQDYFTEDLAVTYSRQCKGLCLFISDVRSVDINMEDSEKADRIVKDMERQMQWHIALNPVASMLKMRLPYPDPAPKPAGSTEYLDGILYFPVWGGRTTTESRLVVVRDDHRERFDVEIAALDGMVVGLDQLASDDISKLSFVASTTAATTPTTPTLATTPPATTPATAAVTTTASSLTSAATSIPASVASCPTPTLSTTVSAATASVSTNPTATTDTDSSSKPHWKTKRWCHRDYEELMFYFNTEMRTTYFEHSCGDFVATKGLCHCFDCSSEIYILKFYCLKFKQVKTRDKLRTRVLELSNDISNSISRSKSGTIRTLMTGWDLLE